ncbi:peptidase M10 [Archangium sp.]|uniref:peptidase M10 n=1 Tax=Archangium sp. TaxID=1872627 RepID=UPI002D625264|nr:peptidase M10 [Archangium sp.]HYO59033.1 peptidase M10 [Archangium sp.]
MLNLRIAASLTVLAVAGCGGPEDLHDTEPVGQTLSWKQFRSQVYMDPEGVFIVDGDTPIHDEKLLREFFEKYVKDGQLIVQTAGGVDVKWDDTQKLNLTYCVSSTEFTSGNYTTVVQAMADATAAWEGVANINFIHKSDQDANCTASNNNVVFDVRPVSFGTYLMRSFTPDAPRDSRNILIDGISFTVSAPLTVTGLLRHELGHVLGFHHEHIRPESGATASFCIENNTWRALTTYDSASVMHFPECNGTGTGAYTLSTKDAQGAAALYGAPGSQPPPSGTPVTETASGSLSTGQTSYYGAYEVVAGTSFKVVMTGTGNPNLYVNFGAYPTTTTYSCRPLLTGASETCDVLVPSGQSKAYIMVKSSNSSTYTLDISYTRPPTGTPTSETVSGSVASGQSEYHGTYEVVAGTYFKVVMTGSGDPDLYVGFGSYPTADSFYCRPLLTGASETCYVLVPPGQTMAYIMVKGSTSATYTLDLSYTRPSTGGPAFETVSGSVASGQSAYHGAYEVVAGSYFKVVMTGTGNPDLYVSFGVYPSANSFYCRPFLSGASETCNVLVPPGETKAYIMVKGITTATYTLNLSYTRP